MKVQKRLVIATIVVATGLAYIAPATVLAAARPRTGWWTQAQQSAYTGNHPLPLDQTPNASDFHVSNAGCPGQIAPCADVPNNPAGGPSAVKFGPTAISGVGYALPGGELPAGTDPGSVIAQLRLTVDGAAVGSGFKLLACRILGAWLPANGGDWTQRPPYQPGGCAVGVPSSDGNTVAFTIVAALAGRNSLDLALVPAVGDPTPFQVLFKSADPDALAWQPLPAPPVPNSNSLASPQPVGAGPTGVAGVAAANPPAGIAPTAPEAAALPPSAGPPGVAVGPRRIGARQVTAITHKRLVLLLLAALLAVVAVTWSKRLRRMMSSDRETVRGLGRFARTRTAHARPL
jgi:hypothetical protein